MRPEEEREILEAALETYGAEAQTLMVFEEMAELQKELCKYARTEDERLKKICRDHIAEEIADVEIMLEQMKILHGCEELTKNTRTIKIFRLGSRIEMKKKEEEGPWESTN